VLLWRMNVSNLKVELQNLKVTSEGQTPMVMRPHRFFAMVQYSLHTRFHRRFECNEEAFEDHSSCLPAVYPLLYRKSNWSAMAKKGGSGGGGGKKRCRATTSNGNSNKLPTTFSKTSAPAAFLPSNNKKAKKNNNKMNKQRQGLLNDDDKSSAVVLASVTTVAATASDSAAATATAATNALILEERRRVQRREQRTAVLTHNTSEKRNAMRLKLHITRTKRELETQKAQLTCWDPVSYYQRKQAQELEKQQHEQEQAAAENGNRGPKKERRRKGPESWKLKGAARPAWQVYDFDTRYVCPHIAAHEQHQERTKRSLNLLALCRQQQEQPQLKPPSILLSSSTAVSNDKKNDNDCPDENSDNKDQAKDENENDSLMFLCRDYLALLMELGHLYLQAKQFKSAREAWLQCLELDYAGMTTAGDELMRMYLDLQRHEAAFRIGQRILSPQQKSSSSGSSSSAWIVYSTALVAWHLKDEKAAEYLEQAIRFNPFCAYYLAFWNTFDGVMEYTHELEREEDDDDDAPPQSSLEEAIEYCSSHDNQQAKRWIAMGGHVALRDILLRTIQKTHPSLARTDVDWNVRLVKLEQFCQEQEEAEAAIAAEVAANELQEDNHEKNTTDSSTTPEVAAEKNDEQQQETASSSTSSNDDGDDEDDEENNSSSNESMPPKVDLAMFVGMFRTAMEMVQEEDPRFAIVL
jgi:tetratricopeptide (TPR) repeat protein